MFLKSPWRWPELWGMNMDEVRNPHRIYPGPDPVPGKDRTAWRGCASASPAAAPDETVRFRRACARGTGRTSIPTLPPHIIEPFLNEAIIVDEGELDMTPRIVGAPEEPRADHPRRPRLRRGRDGLPLVESEPRSRLYRIFRNATPLRDPVTEAVLGYEARTWARPNWCAARASRCGPMAGPGRPIVPATSTSPAPRRRSASATACCPSPRARS